MRHGVIPQEEGRRRAIGVGGPPGNSEEYGLNKALGRMEDSQDCIVVVEFIQKEILHIYG